MSNLRPAPFYLRPSVVRALLEPVRRAGPKRTVEVPVLPVVLADEVRAENTEMTRLDASHPAPVNDTESAATQSPKGDIAGPPAQAPEGSSEGVRGGAHDHLANVCEQRLPEKKPAEPVMLEPAPRPMRMPPPVKVRRERAAPLAEVGYDTRSPEDDETAAEFAAALAKVQARRSTAAPTSKKADYARFAANMLARRVADKPVKPAPTEHAPSRESCTRCGIPGWKGCDHWLPCAAAPIVPKLVTSTAAEPEAHSGATVKRLSAEELAFVDARRDLTRKEIHAAFVAQFPDRPISVTNINYILARAIDFEVRRG